MPIFSKRINEKGTEISNNTKANAITGRIKTDIIVETSLKAGDVIAFHEELETLINKYNEV